MTVRGAPAIGAAGGACAFAQSDKTFANPQSLKGFGMVLAAQRSAARDVPSLLKVRRACVRVCARSYALRTGSRARQGRAGRSTSNSRQLELGNRGK